MANLITEGFDWFPSGQSQPTRARLWAANNFFYISSSGGLAADVTTGRFSFGNAMLFNGGFVGFSYSIPFGAPVATGFCGCALFIDPANTSPPLIQFMDSVNNTMQVTIGFMPNGVIKAWNGSYNATLLGASYAGVYQQNEWLHVEIKATIANSGGTVEVRINTVPVLQVVGADTQVTAVAGFDSIALGNYQSFFNGAVSNFYFDDFFVNDTTGSTNNTWSGNLRVKTQFMIANGATDNFTIGGTSPAATQWQSVLNQQLDDTKYVYSSNIGDIDLFTPDPNLNSPLVRVVQVRMGLRQDDATQRVARALLRIGGVNYIGSVDQYTNQTYTFYKQRWELNPATSVSFTGADVNGLQAGTKVQA